jgi:peptidoglycan hydrolase-like protein with peptidoglycan-binding domain
VLHTQVRTLQKNLDVKTEQVRQLKQQLENKGTQDIGALSEQLREAKREAQAWKLKADIAEKQVEVMSKLSAGRRLVDWTEQSDKPYLRHVEPRPVLGETTRQAIRGMDGAASSQRLTSEESNDTILHDFAVTGTEFDSWADHVGTDLSSRSLLELDSKLELHISKLELDGNSPKLLDFGDSE